MIDATDEAGTACEEEMAAAASSAAVVPALGGTMPGAATLGVGGSFGGDPKLKPTGLPREPPAGVGVPKDQLFPGDDPKPKLERAGRFSAGTGVGGV